MIFKIFILYIFHFYVWCGNLLISWVTPSPIKGKGYNIDLCQHSSWRKILFSRLRFHIVWRSLIGNTYKNCYCSILYTIFLMISLFEFYSGFWKENLKNEFIELFVLRDMREKCSEIVLFHLFLPVSFPTSLIDSGFLLGTKKVILSMCYFLQSNIMCRLKSFKMKPL